MSWNKFYVTQASLMVLSSTANTLSTKWADHLHAESSDGQVRSFSHPFVQACSSFFGEFLCLLLYKASHSCRHLQAKKKIGEEEENVVNFNPLIFIIPAVCDMVGTSLMYIGLNLTYASSYQMLRGAVIVFVALLSVAFLGREVSKKEWLGIFFTIIGLTTVGLSNHFLKSSSMVDLDSNSIITGDLLIVLATMIRAIEMVYEEKFCVSKDIPPLQAVGWEGAFGFMILSTLMFPMSYVKVGPPFSNNAQSVLEDFPDAIVQMRNNKLIVLALAGAVVSTSLSNYAGVYIMKHLTSTTRMVLETIPTLFVWLSSICLGWQTFHPLQILGFALVVLGMCLYNNITSGFCQFRCS
ncbi:solute carrier family 35 member F6 isoform X1 [Bemisia tabaci]|nr:PREDICTED: solute carrier family 35 member F6-like isoform X1 [Bemisia tabaci]